MVIVKISASAFGLSTAGWGVAKEDLRAALVHAAADQRMTWYRELAAQLATVGLQAHAMLMHSLLGLILREEHAHGRPLLTAIVTYKQGDDQPSPGFYEMAQLLGYRFDEPHLFWANQVEDTFLHYGRISR
jgi:hypothetical protein